MRTWPRLLCASLAATLVVVSAAGGARAQEPEPAGWDPAYTHAGRWDYALGVFGGGMLLTETILLQNHEPEARWFGPILFDQAAHDATRGRWPQLRGDAATASWVLWFALMGYPLAVDVPYAWSRYGSQVAWDLFWQDATVLTLSGAFDFAARDLVGRVRPSNQECLDSGGTRTGCLRGPETRRSFPSGHVTETTTATALLCTQHLKLKLYGGPWDAVACLTAIVADVAVGTLRLVADNHWATDVVAGGAIGVAFGWGIPTLMHLHGHAPSVTIGRGASAIRMAPVPIAVGAGGGLGMAGWF